MYNYAENRYSLDPPPFLQSEYKMATHRLERQLPLPGQSVKVPYKEQPTRFLNLNRKKYEIDYLRDQIQHKVKMEQLHYQARIQQMRRQNQLNRYRLQQMLLEHPERNLYASPKQIADQTKSNHSDLSNLSLKQLLRRRDKMVYQDSIDKVKLNKSGDLSARSRTGRDNRHSQSVVLDDSDSDETEKKYKQKVQRQEELDYIYQKRDHAKSEKTNRHFSVDLRKKNAPEQEDIEKRKQYEWVKKVRRARGNPIFVVPEVKSDDTSSKPSSSSKSSISKPSTKKSNIFSRRSSRSSSESKSLQSSRLKPISQRPSVRQPPPQRQPSVRQAPSEQIRTPLGKRRINPQDSFQRNQKYIDKYQASENSSLKSSSVNRSNWKR